MCCAGECIGVVALAISLDDPAVLDVSSIVHVHGNSARAQKYRQIIEIWTQWFGFSILYQLLPILVLE